MTKQVLNFFSESNSWPDGTTLVSCFSVNKDGSSKIYVANTGDSRAILVTCEKGEKVVEMSQDHKPDKVAEKARIVRNGGKVVLAGTWYKFKKF